MQLIKCDKPTAKLEKSGAPHKGHQGYYEEGEDGDYYEHKIETGEWFRLDDGSARALRIRNRLRSVGYGV